MNELNFLDSIFNDFLGDASNNLYRTSLAPRVDVKEEENGYTLEMDLPGHSEKDVNIELEQEKLTISSKAESKKDEKCNDKAKWILKERRCGEFERKFLLPKDVDCENINASFKNGVLTINMKKKAMSAPKKILIETAS